MSASCFQIECQNLIATFLFREEGFFNAIYTTTGSSKMLQSKMRVLDGGLATTLQDLGHNIEGDPLWSARLLYNQPSAIYDVHSQFLCAGSTILSTGSYQASIDGFHKYLGLTPEDSLSLIRKSVQIAKDARDSFGGGNEILVAGSVGPYGACLADGSEYTGSYMQNITKKELIEWHQPRIDALVAAGVDLLAIETIPSLDEAISILQLLQSYPSVAAYVSFSCKNGHETNYGDNFGEAAQACYNMNSQQLVGIGINCTNPLFVTSLLTDASKYIPVSFPRVVYPNSGELWKKDGGWVGTSVSLVNIIHKELETWHKLGVTVIGGCCRVHPREIEVISKYVKEYCESGKVS